MPPESLSILAVIKPGPSTARKSSMRIRQRLSIRDFLLFGSQECDYMVRLPPSPQPVGAIHPRQRMQIVLVEEFRDFILVRFRRTGDDARLGQNSNPCFRERQD